MTANPGARRVPGILVAHAGLADALRDTAEQIAGPAPDLLTLSNADASTESLTGEIGRALEERGPGTVVLVDLAGGSCHSAALRAARGRSGVHVVAGANLALVVVFLQKRDELTAAELVKYITERARAGILATAPENGA
jgi:mannose/fructose-specific phosphotransferase system component IIA